MRRLELILLLTLLCFYSFGQGTLGKEKAQINVGLGMTGWGVPIIFGVDYGIADDFTIGGEISFRSYKEKFAGIFYSHAITGLSGNVNYHFNRIMDLPQEWDFYAGLNLGFYFWSSPRNYLGSGSSGLGLGAQVGGRYFLNNKFGFNIEFGGGNVFYGGKIGLTIKI